MTHALLPNSPALNAADETLCSATDQRGIARPQGLGCDIGAFELEEAPQTVQPGPTFTVNKTSDTADGTCSTTDCSLREAIIAANAYNGGAGGATVSIPAGTYTLDRINYTPEDADATYNDLDITASVTIVGAGRDATVIHSALGPVGFDMFYIHGVFNVSFSDLTLRNGSSAIYVDGYGDTDPSPPPATLTITNVRFTESINGSGGSHGIIANRVNTIITNSLFDHNSNDGIIRNFYGAMTIDQTQFVDNGDPNRASVVYSLIQSEGASPNHQAALTITNSQFVESAPIGNGSFSTLLIDNTTFEGSRGTAVGNGSQLPVTIRNSQFSNGQIVFDYLGWGAPKPATAISNGGTQLRVENTTFTNDSINNSGNAVFTNVELNNSEISNGSGATTHGASASGTFSLLDSTVDQGFVENVFGTMTITRTIFDGASLRGGESIGLFGVPLATQTTITQSAILNVNGTPAVFNGISGTLTATNVTIAGNQTEAISNNGTLTLTHVTVAGNTGIGVVNSGTVNVIQTQIGSNSGDNCQNTGTINPTALNIADDATCTGFTQVADLLLATLTDGYFPLTTTSPALGAADEILCPATDQRGVARPQGLGCDIGAFESDLNPPVPMPENPVVNEVGDLGANIAWMNNTPNAFDQFRVERLTGDAGVLSGSAWGEIATLPNYATNHTDNNLSCGTTYSYRVRAYRAADDSYSDYSTYVTITTDACDAPVTNTVGLYRNGIWQFRDQNTTGAPTLRFVYGPQEAGWQPLTGDWDGDGTDGIGLYKDGIFLLRNATGAGAQDLVFRFGDNQAGWQALAGDWNGDGVDTIGLYKNGQVILRNTNSAGGAEISFRFTFPTAGMIAVAGDFDASGADSIGLYKDGIWYLHNSLTDVSGIRAFAFGPTQSGWLPVTGDWNADGVTTVGLQRGDVWRLRDSNSAGGADVGFNFGVANDTSWLPLASYRGGMAVLTVISQGLPNPLDISATPLPEMTEPVVAPTETPLATPAEATPEVTPPAEVITPAPAETTPEATPVPTDIPATAPPPAPEATAEATAAP